MPVPPTISIGQVLRAALYRNPDLLDSLDALVSSRIAERGVASTFVPQVTPFVSFDRSHDASQRADTYGIAASQLFQFGTLLEGLASVTRSPGASGDAAFNSDYRVTLTQPLLRGADPAVTREPLREARRTVSSSERSLEVLRRRTVILIYQTYLGIAREQEALRLASERYDRSRKLTEFSRARFAAGSVSRLDVLRAEQQDASIALTLNDARNAAEDFFDQLRRAAGLGRELQFAIEPPERLPMDEPAENEAVQSALELRPEAIEAKDQVTDAEFAVRIAKSLQLPSLSAVASYETFGVGPTPGDALRGRSPAFILGLRSQYGLNTAVLDAQRREAEVALETRRRNLLLLDDDLVREVRLAYRQLRQSEHDHEIAARNVEVAEMQSQVARLRFEKGLSDNFNVVDAENLWNSTKLLESNSRYDILLARLACLFAAGQLEVAPFLRQP
jgi:outer membrane protein TolC